MQDLMQEIPPHPEAISVELTVRCYTDPAHKSYRSHPILLHQDWTVDTGHDLELERFSVAFGGYLSCLELAERTVPALRTYLTRQLRGELPRVTLTVGGRWVPTQRVETCCAGSTSFATATEAAAHMRSARHVASELGTRTTWVGSLGGTLLESRGLRDPVRLPEDAMRLVGRQVPRPRDVVFLWECGLTPELVEAVHAQASDGRLLNPSFYLGVLTRRPDLAWVRSTARQVPDRDVQDWLAWSETEQDRQEPELRGTWLRMGVSRKDLAVLSGSPYGPADVGLLAHHLGLTPTAAAASLARLVEARCCPRILDLVEVALDADVGLSAVSGMALDRLAEVLEPHRLAGTREQLAFALMHCGAPAITAQIAVKVGSLRSDDIRRGLQEWERERQGRRYARA